MSTTAGRGQREMENKITKETRNVARLLRQMADKKQVEKKIGLSDKQEQQVTKKMMTHSSEHNDPLAEDPSWKNLISQYYNCVLFVVKPDNKLSPDSVHHHRHTIWETVSHNALVVVKCLCCITKNIFVLFVYDKKNVRT